MLCTPSAADRLRDHIASSNSLHDRIYALRALLDYRIASDAALSDHVQALRYRAYRHEGATDIRASRRLDDCFDLCSNAATIALCFEGHVCASIRLHVITEDQRESPAMHAFEAELAPLAEAGERLVDPNCFCVDPLLSGGMPELAYLTLRLPFITAGLRVRSSVTATVRAEHGAFYRRVLRCHPVVAPRAYPGRTKPLGLMLVSYDAEAANVLARYPFFAAAPGEAESIGLDRIGKANPAARPELADLVA